MPVCNISKYLDNLLEPNRTKFLTLHDDLDGFKSMPASVKYHHQYKGGLYEHTYQVIQLSLDMWKLLLNKTNTYINSALINYITYDDVVINAFIHDLDKCNKYSYNSNYKIHSNNEFIINHNRVDMNSSVRTVSILASYGIILSDVQLNALVYAEGGYSVEFKGNPYGKLEPLASIIHSADMLSTYFSNNYSLDSKPVDYWK